MMFEKVYYVYITTNVNKGVLYIGVTNSLCKRMHEHKTLLHPYSFTARYYAFHLIYYETFSDINIAIAREKQLKRWSRQKKETLIAVKNPNWEFIELDCHCE